MRLVCEGRHTAPLKTSGARYRARCSRVVPCFLVRPTNPRMLLSLRPPVSASLGAVSCKLSAEDISFSPPPLWASFVNISASELWTRERAPLSLWLLVQFTITSGKTKARRTKPHIMKVTLLTALSSLLVLDKCFHRLRAPILMSLERRCQPGFRFMLSRTSISTRSYQQRQRL